MFILANREKLALLTGSWIYCCVCECFAFAEGLAWKRGKAQWVTCEVAEITHGTIFSKVLMNTSHFIFLRWDVLFFLSDLDIVKLACLSVFKNSEIVYRLKFV